MTPNRIVHFSAALCALALLAACDDSPKNTQAPAPNVPTAPQAKSNKAPAPTTPPPAPSLQLAPLAPPTSAFYVGGKTPKTSLIPGNKPDIAGIRIGEPLNPSLITKLNPAYKIQKYTRDGRESGIDARTPNDHLVVMWNDEGLVWHVGRYIGLEEKERFMFDTLKASLLEKYGDPSRDPSQEPAKERSESDLSPVIVTTGSRSFEKDLRWNYDREGKFLHGSEALSLCGWDHTNMPPGSFKPTCGYKIEVDVSIHNRTIDNRIGEGPVTSYRIAITYVKPIFDELVIKDEEEKLAKQRRVQQNRPQL